MESIVYEELRKLGVPRVFVITFDRKGEHHVTEGITGHIYNLAEECMLFYLFKGVWSIRYIDENHEVHPEYIGRYGFRMNVDENEFRIYRNKQKLGSSPIDSNDFENCFEAAWNFLAEESIQFHSELSE